MCPRGAPRDNKLEEWWTRAAEAIESEAGVWVRERSAELWEEVRRRAGMSAGRRDPAPRREPEPREPEPREPEVVRDPVTPGPRDTIFF